MGQLQQFLYPVARYRGAMDGYSAEFNRHLQLFAQRVTFLASLHTGGKLSTDETYRQLLSCWNELRPYLSLVVEHQPLETAADFRPLEAD
ncbi:MAG: hypothetical protein Q6L50_03275 [Gloeomargarita sp. GMQP_bins_120]